MPRLMKIVRTETIEAPGLGQRIKQAREADKRPLKEIAAAAGMTTMNWYRVEAEKQMLPEETLRQIEKALGVDFGVEFPDRD